MRLEREREREVGLELEGFCCERRVTRVGRGLWVSKKKEEEAGKSLKLASGGEGDWEGGFAGLS